MTESSFAVISEARVPPELYSLLPTPSKTMIVVPSFAYCESDVKSSLSRTSSWLTSLSALMKMLDSLLLTRFPTPANVAMMSAA